MQDRRRSLERRAAFIAVVVILQIFATMFFVVDILGDLRADGWTAHLAVEGGSTAALCAGVLFGAIQLRGLVLQARQDEALIAAARGAMADLVRQRFLDWRLTAAEADVALFALKGFDTAEIAALRGAAAGTIRAQLARIYAKAGVHSQVTLMALMAEELIPTKA